MAEITVVLKKASMTGNRKQKKKKVEKFLFHHIERPRHIFFLKIRNLELENLFDQLLRRAQ